MLAPRKKLWSTPSSAIDVALNFVQLDENDVVYDVGCGDGRVLIRMASRSIPFIPGGLSGSTNIHIDSQTPSQSSFTQHYCTRFVGIEISPERADEARSNILHAQNTNQIAPHVSIEIICANALDTDVIDYSRATVIFLYLVPRGLRLIKPIIWSKEEIRCNSEQTTAQRQQEKTKFRRIITYMSPFEDEEYVRKEVCRVPHQAGAAWPVYLYHTR